jgi:hypothetical protein
VLDGSAHAQYLFQSDQGARVMQEIVRFLSAPWHAAVRGFRLECDVLGGMSATRTFQSPESRLPPRLVAKLASCR